MTRKWKPDNNAQRSSANCSAAHFGGCFCSGRCMHQETGEHPMWQKDGSKPVFLEVTGSDVLTNEMPPGGVMYYKPGMTREERLREARELVKLLHEIGQEEEAQAVAAKIREELKL